MSNASSESWDDFDDSVELAQDLVVLATELSPELIRVATLSQLLVALPHILHHINSAHRAKRHCTLTDALCKRLHKSRRLKLRFLLLRHHPAFRSLPVKLRFSSRAYEKDTHQPYVSRTACSTSHIDLSLDSNEPLSTSISVKVDLVDLQNHDFFSNTVFKKYENGSFQRIGLQLISHVFEVQTEERTPDEVCSAVYSVNGSAEESGGDENDEGEGFALMAYMQVDRGESIVDIRQASGVIHLSHVEKRAKPSSSISSTTSSQPSPLTSASISNSCPVRALRARSVNGSADAKNDRLSNSSKDKDRERNRDADRDRERNRARNKSTDEQDTEFRVVHPRAYVRHNDDVLRVQVVQLTLQLMNEVWRRQWSADPLSAPFVVTVDAVAVSGTQGLVQVVARESRVIDASTEDPILIDQLVRSTAGAVTAAYVLGIHHHELCVKDGYTAFWRTTPHTVAGPPGTGANISAFSQLFETTINSPNPTTFPRLFKNALKQLHVWDVFRRLCVQAFVALRHAWQSVFAPVVVPLFIDCGISRRQIEQFMQGRHSLFLSDKDDLKSQVNFRKCIS